MKNEYARLYPNTAMPGMYNDMKALIEQAQEEEKKSKQQQKPPPVDINNQNDLSGDSSGRRLPESHKQRGPPANRTRRSVQKESDDESSWSSENEHERSRILAAQY